MVHIDDFLREIEQKIQNKEKINTRDIHIFANLYAHNCITDATVIAKLNLFIIDMFTVQKDLKKVFGDVYIMRTWQ